MITNDGKNILSKYLVGQVPSYASYIAVGCGVKPKASDYIFTQSDKTEYAAKKSLDFEMFRVPIISRGYIDDNGTSKVVFTAELPTEERYEISEIGVYSAGANPSAGAYDSRTLFSFSNTENWEFHSPTAATQIPSIYTPLDGEDNDNVINTTETAFQTNADNRIFTNSSRENRYERCRFLNNIIAVSGDMSDLYTDSSNNIVFSSGSHIHLNGISLDFDKQSAKDEIRIAFSVINRNGSSVVNPKKVLILLEFDAADETGIAQSAKYPIIINHTSGDSIYNFSNNRYFVIKKQLQNLIKDAGFSWSQVNIVKIYACVLDSNDDPSSDFFVCFDAVRLENTSTENPLYGMTGYSVALNTASKTIVKSANTTNYIEFRFSMDVQ